jgi:uncharacterized protein with von Willebrand factor type A (vWA) domain
MDDIKDEVQPEPEVVDETAGKPEEAITPDPVVEEDERTKNLKMENARKAQEIQRLREQLEATTKAAPTFNPNDLTTWQDRELKAVLKDPQYAHLHDQAEALLDKRKFRRYQAEQEEQNVRMGAELERQKNFPETFDPTHPMSARMSEILHSYRLDNTPAGRLVAAKLAASEFAAKRAEAVGRKKEQDRQADVKASYTGESRPAPKPTDSVKVEELKKRAQAGDLEAKRQWFKLRGLI